VATALIAVVAVLLGVAIAVQVYYMRGLSKAGVEVTRATKVVSYANISMLVLLLVGLLALAFSGRLTLAAGG